MRCCQVCAFTSWGPIGDPAELTRLSEFAPDARVNEFVRCDHCKSVARRDLLQEPAPRMLQAEPAAPDLMGIVKAFVPPLPPFSVPPTRTERLVCTLLRSDLLDTTEVDTAQSIVAFARDLEIALDAPWVPTPDPTACQPWWVLTFAAREEFEIWLTGLWDAINAAHPGFTATAEYPDSWYDTAVTYVTGKRS